MRPVGPTIIKLAHARRKKTPTFFTQQKRPFFAVHHHHHGSKIGAPLHATEINPHVDSRRTTATVFMWPSGGESLPNL